MALDELHARRLTTVLDLVESAMDRIELVLRGIENSRDSPQASRALTAIEIHRIREKMESLRRRINGALKRFSLRPHKPEARQVLAAELSALWVMLENSTPRRMRGYGREFDPKDLADWESLIRDLLSEVEKMRRAILPHTGGAPFSSPSLAGDD